LSASEGGIPRDRFERGGGLALEQRHRGLAQRAQPIAGERRHHRGGQRAVTRPELRGGDVLVDCPLDSGDRAVVQSRLDLLAEVGDRLAEPLILRAEIRLVGGDQRDALHALPAERTGIALDVAEALGQPALPAPVHRVSGDLLGHLALGVGRHALQRPAQQRRDEVLLGSQRSQTSRREVRGRRGWRSDDRAPAQAIALPRLAASLGDGPANGEAADRVGATRKDEWKRKSIARERLCAEDWPRDLGERPRFLKGRQLAALFLREGVCFGLRMTKPARLSKARLGTGRQPTPSERLQPTRPRGAGITRASLSCAARTMTSASCRTLPGHGYAARAARASRDSVRGPSP
jgi:hypothetical protein